MSTRALIVVCVTLLLWPVSAAAQTFAVVALDDEARATELDAEVAINLRNAGIGVVGGEELAGELKKRQSEEPDTELLGRFAGLTTSIASGVNEYFYSGNDSAIELLGPAFDLGVNHRDVLARRPDYADQIYSAGVVLIRAYQAKDQDESARAVVGILSRHFPSKTASAATVPPKVIRLIESAKADVATSETYVSFEGIGEGNCTTYLNGFPVSETVAVVPGVTYYVRHDCGRERTPTWAFVADKGTTQVVPLMSGQLADFNLESASVRDRRRAESLMGAIAFWTGLDGVVGASTKGVTDTDVVIGRWTRQGVSWSDGISSKNLQAALSRVFPELDEERLASAPSAEATESGKARSGPGLMPWISIGGGTALVGTGVLLFVSAESLDETIRCSPSVGNQADCTGVEEIAYTPDEIEQAQSRVQLFRIGAYTSWALGAAALGYGIYALVSGDDTDGENPSTSIFIAPDINGGSANVVVRW